MSQRHLLPMPQFSVNDESAKVNEWHVDSGAAVQAGDLICTAETSKAAFEIEAEQDGFLFPLADRGDRVTTGDPLAVISDSVSDKLEDVRAWADSLERKKQAEAKPVARYTKKAQVLAERLGLDIADVPVTGDRVTEEDVLRHRDRQGGGGESADSGFAATGDIIDSVHATGRAERILIVGGGDGAVQLIDAVRGSRTQRFVGIVDDNEELVGRTILGVPIVGKIADQSVAELHKAGKFDAAIVSISTNISFRSKTFARLSGEGIPFTNILHPTVFSGLNLDIGTGNVILAFCHLGACAKIGDNNFVSAYCSLEHHSVLGDGSSFGPGVITSSSVKIADRVRFGTGIFIEPFVNVGSDSVIASGSILIGDVPAEHVVKTQSSLRVRRL